MSEARRTLIVFVCKVVSRSQDVQSAFAPKIRINSYTVTVIEQNKRFPVRLPRWQYNSSRRSEPTTGAFFGYTESAELSWSADLPVIG